MPTAKTLPSPPNTGSGPLLIVIAGAARGRSVRLDGTTTIGRDERNDLPIPDPALSRQHCIIERHGERVILKDMASKNGVFVNGCPISERTLADGDQVRIGDSAFVVLMLGNAPPADPVDSGVTMIESQPPTSTTIAMEGARRRYFAPTVDVTTPRATQDLALLFRLSDALQTVTAADALYEVLLRHALEAADARGASILINAPDDDSLSVVMSKSVASEPVTVCRSVAERAIAERSAVSADDTPLLCVPLLGSDTSRGALCLNDPRNATRFTEDDLRLLAAIGSIGGLALQRLQHLDWLSGENARLRQDVAIEHSLVGESAAMQGVYRFIGRAAPTDATVLLHGESGTGKELVAHAIHTNSRRANGPFIAINCAALPDALLESELFGHERGAFTGAVAQQRGRLEMADRGTVFLDEIGELAPPLQAKLLRVLQDQIVERIGARRGIKIDARVIAATNCNLEQAISQGTFRKDLYYRLNVVTLTIPPLRERREDVPLLAAYFVRRHAAKCQRTVKGIAPAARALLSRYDWPGNVRELSNAIERAVVLGSSDVIMPDDLPEGVHEVGCDGAEPTGYHARVAATKREIIRDTLERNGGNVAKTARALDLQPTYLHRLIRNLGLRDEATKEDPTA